MKEVISTLLGLVWHLSDSQSYERVYEKRTAVLYKKSVDVIVLSDKRFSIIPFEKLNTERTAGKWIFFF